MLRDKTAERIYLLAIALIVVPLLFASWSIFQDTPLKEGIGGDEATGVRMLIAALMTALSFGTLQLVSNRIRRIFHQDGGAVSWLFEAIVGAVGCTTAPTFVQMHHVQGQCVEFPELARVAGAWASQREDGLLDGTDLMQLCSAGARLAASKAKAEKIQRRLNRKRLAEEAKVKQREEIARDMQGSGLAAAIEAHRFARALEVSTPEATGQGDGSRRL